jgi:hypothetical protein
MFFLTLTIVAVLFLEVLLNVTVSKAELVPAAGFVEFPNLLPVLVFDNDLDSFSFHYWFGGSAPPLLTLPG